MKKAYKRILSAIIGIILLLVAINKGGLYLNIGILIVSLIGVREFYLAIEKINIYPLKYIGYFATVLIFLNNFYSFINRGFILTISLIISLIIFLFDNNSKLEDVGMTLLGIAYIPFLFSYINKLDGNVYIWLIFLISFGTDTFAYLGGKYLGKRKLWPEISPNKTIEGAFTGMVGSVFLTGIFSYIVDGPLYIILPLAIIVSIISQIGDLIASKIKRSVKLKDYGSIMPGHGGILDRFDSILIATPIVYYYIKCFLN